MVSVNEVRFGALKALDGMLAITHNEMLRRGCYLSEDVVDHELAAEGALCHGHQACAVGALWLGAGVELEYGKDGSAWLPGVDFAWTGDGPRERLLAKMPALKLAYDAMNVVSQNYIDEFDLIVTEQFSAPMEQLFESMDPLGNGPLIDAHEVFPVLIAQAVQMIRDGWR